jgi:hypothetical protein
MKMGLSPSAARLTQKTVQLQIRGGLDVRPLENMIDYLNGMMNAWTSLDVRRIHRGTLPNRGRGQEAFCRSLGRTIGRFRRTLSTLGRGRRGGANRADLLLNDVLPEAALARLQKFFRETSGKLSDAVAGIYRYRKIDATPSRRGRRRKTQ